RDLDQSRPLKGLRILDIGCGGGLITEPMARLGAAVVGADAAPTNIEVAKIHAEESDLPIDYRMTTAEAMADDHEVFDVVLALEIVEHVASPVDFVDTCARLLKPGGILIMSTLNRTTKSFALGIIGAEWVMRWLPKGTHDWKRFITPDELDAMAVAARLDPLDRKGMVFNPISWQWSISHRDLSVNYLTLSVAPSV
ncbi:MAG: bifunctional 2-polyprenyl-6-hydroxyphenol methylase/3-demethylubiquinol 3-O-methyltransferase UbiG, partial [Deltaproteobacteria bacterium]